MPDHVHLILTHKTDTAHQQVYSLPVIMKAIKSASAHRINRRFGLQGAVWQEESFDHVLRCSESLDQKIDYILKNPVRRGLVDNWDTYRWLWRQPSPNAYKPPT